jgi:hypothetical protein
MLHLFGIDHERLTFKHPGRRFRFTDLEGKVRKGFFVLKIYPVQGVVGKRLVGILGSGKEVG